MKDGGAVVNEAMSAGCAVVASEEMGSVPFLIKDGQNGFSFRKTGELLEKTETLIKNTELCAQIQREAKTTIEEVWNPHVAAAHLVALCEELLLGKPVDERRSGPCEKI